MKMVKKLILSSIMVLVLVLSIGCSNAKDKVKSNFEANLAALEMYKYDEKGISDALTEAEYKQIQNYNDKDKVSMVEQLTPLYGKENAEKIYNVIVKLIQGVEKTVTVESSSKDKITLKVVSKALDTRKIMSKANYLVKSYVTDEKNYNKSEKEVQDDMAKIIIDIYNKKPTKEVITLITYTKKEGKWQPPGNMQKLCEGIYTN
ncbi:hypothetical protein IC171_01245 [Clostridioides sp. ES-S-0171-01]|nr:hypothetical protein [Clostridioides sp. ES-S-0171-01]MCC0686560.1 hypothetical protein [Clostridioides sp. ES-S-0056-01]MCC0713920.1 hypothetical protein [Clostridioides sp. ES-S-0077-01]UDN55144.1 hypothetical protein JJC02_02840 [Clostridioides sp. ES-S-0054-01]